jgi:hypothetical protein
MSNVASSITNNPLVGNNQGEYLSSLCQYLCEKDPACQAVRYNTDTTGCDFFRIPMYTKELCGDENSPCTGKSVKPYGKNALPAYCGASSKRRCMVETHTMEINPDVLINNIFDNLDYEAIEHNVILQHSQSNQVLDNSISCYMKTGSVFIASGVCVGSQDENIYSVFVPSATDEDACERKCRNTPGCQGYMYTDRSIIEGLSPTDLSTALQADHASFSALSEFYPWQCHHFAHPGWNTTVTSNRYTDCIADSSASCAPALIAKTNADLTHLPFLCFRLNIYFANTDYKTAYVQDTKDDDEATEDRIHNLVCDTE